MDSLGSCGESVQPVLCFNICLFPLGAGIDACVSDVVRQLLPDRDKSCVTEDVIVSPSELLQQRDLGGVSEASLTEREQLYSREWSALGSCGQVQIFFP